MEKAQIRRELLSRRHALSSSERLLWDAAIGKQLLAWCQQQRPASIGLFWPIQAEPDLLTYYRDLAQLGAALSLPVVQAAGRPLRYARWQPGEPTVRGALGVPVPATLEWVELPESILIPCVGHNTQGFRLGYGGGFYDRTLACQPRPYALGISYPVLETEFAVDAHDIALDQILTGALPPAPFRAG